MFRPSLRATVTTLAAAAVLVGGADIATYAATGHPLVLGHANQAGGTTSLKNTGRGPALSLNSIKSAPPLKLNSSKMVKHLNANMVGGMTAKTLNGYDLYRLGQSGGTIDTDAHFFTIKPPTGWVHYSMTGIWTSQTTTDSLECLLVDKRLVNNPSNISLIYGEFIRTISDQDGPFINQQGFAKFSKNQRLLIGCAASGTGPIQIAQPITFSFHSVGAAIKHGKPFDITKNAQRKLQAPARALSSPIRSPLAHRGQGAAPIGALWRAVRAQNTHSHLNPHIRRRSHASSSIPPSEPHHGGRGHRPGGRRRTHVVRRHRQRVRPRSRQQGRRHHVAEEHRPWSGAQPEQHQVGSAAGRQQQEDGQEPQRQHGRRQVREPARGQDHPVPHRLRRRHLHRNHAEAVLRQDPQGHLPDRDLGHRVRRRRLRRQLHLPGG